MHRREEDGVTGGGTARGETRSSAQANCSAKSLAGNVVDSSVSSTSHAVQSWGVGEGEGVRGRGQGTFHPPCHKLHYHMVLRPEGTSHNHLSLFARVFSCSTRSLTTQRLCFALAVVWVRGTWSNSEEFRRKRTLSTSTVSMLTISPTVFVLRALLLSRRHCSGNSATQSQQTARPRAQS